MTQKGSFVATTIGSGEETSKSENGSHVIKSIISQGTKIPKIDSFQKRIIGQSSNASSLLGDITTAGTEFMQQYRIPCYIVSPIFMGKKWKISMDNFIVNLFNNFTISNYISIF